MTPATHLPGGAYAATASQPVRVRDGLNTRTVHLCLLTAYSAVYLLITIPTALTRLLWNDELFTLSIAGRPFHEMWRILANGVDQLPPAFCAISHAALSLGGPLELRLRAPEIFGFWLMGVCLFEIIAFRTTLVHGAIAALLPCVSAASLYAFEARPYGLVLGFTGLALLFWQRAGSDGRDSWALRGFACALAAATASHYYAVFVALPFAAAEVFHWWQTREFRVRIWLCLAAAGLPVLAAAPLLRSAGLVAHAFWAHAHLHSIVEAYSELLGHVFLLLLVAGLVGFVILFCGPQTDGPRRRWLPPAREIIPIALLAALPVAVVPIAMLTTGAFTGRYVIALLPGICFLVSWGIYGLTAHRPGLSTLALTLVLAAAAIHGLRLYRSTGADRAEQFSLAAYLGDQQPASLPVVITDPHSFFQFSHYAPPQLARRMIYLADVPLALRHTGTDTVDSGMQALAPLTGARVSGFDSFLKSNSRFLVYGYPSGTKWAWVIPELLARHTAMQVAGSYQGQLLFLVQPGH